MGAGRKRIEIDEGIFKKLCGIFCTKEEIAGVFDVPPRVGRVD